MQTNRFDAIAAELVRLSAEIEAINRQPFEMRIDLRSEKREQDEDTAALLRLREKLLDG